MTDETTDKLSKDHPSQPESDVFLWANNLVPIKEELKIELFLFNKNGVVYRPSVSKDLSRQMQPLFIDGLLEAVLSGLDQGMIVRDFEEAEAETNVLQKVQLEKVTKAQELINWLKTQEAYIEQFVDEEHDIKRMKGIVARCRHDELPYTFYIVKLLPASSIVKGTKSWMMKDGKFVPFTADGSITIPSDNQVLILDQDIYVFNQTRLEQLFGYNAKKYGIAQKKMEQIEANFRFNFDAGLSWESLVQGQKSLVNKLQKLELQGITQDQIVKHAEELGIDLMIDDSGAIIIIDAKDLTKFINLLNEDFIESPLTGKRYEIKSKRELKIAEPDGE
jgi:hypothetical protein